MPLWLYPFIDLCLCTFHFSNDLHVLSILFLFRLFLHFVIVILALPFLPNLLLLALPLLAIFIEVHHSIQEPLLKIIILL